MMSLKQYLELAYREVHLSWGRVLSTFKHIDCTLQPDHENLILLYGGSFNPPHRGHIDVLLSGLRPEVGATAIVVLPCEDYLLRNKMANHESKFFLGSPRRAAIWESIASTTRDRVWVWTSTFFPFKAMIEALIRLAKADGYKVAFSHLIGPDNLRMHDPLAILPYVCDRILVSNKARHLTAHFLPDKTPAIWGGFGKWSRCQCHGAKVYNGDCAGEAVLWTCRGAGDDHNTEKVGYYLEFAEPNATDINSTDLRATFSKNHCVDEMSLNQLSTEALMDLLADVL